MIRIERMGWLLCCLCWTTLSRAQSAAAEPGGQAVGSNNAAGDIGAQSAAAATDAPHRGSVVVGLTLGGGQIRDKVMGAGGVALGLQLGYFPHEIFGVALSGGVFSHDVDDKRKLALYNGALLAEVHPLPRLWLAAGPGYYSLALNVDGDDAAKAAAKPSSHGVGGEVQLGYDVYRPKADGGLSVGVVLRGQAAPIDSQTLYSTLALLNVRYYTGGGHPNTVTSASSPAPVAEAAPATQPEASREPLSVSSSCGDPIQQLLSAINIGGRPCAYNLGGGGLTQVATSFAARLLKGTSYGVWLGKLTGIGNEVRGISVRYDSTKRAIQLLRHDASGVTASGIKTLANGGAAQRWRIARTSQRALVWLNDELVANELNPDGNDGGILTEDGSVEISHAERAPIAPERARELDRSAPVDWPATPQALTVETETAPVAPPPAAPTPTLEPKQALLHDYYRELNGGGNVTSYFAPRVSRYIGMRDTSAAAIQTYLTGSFPLQFRQATFEMEDRTYQSDGPDQYSFIERARYFNVSKGKYEKVVSLVRVRFSPDGKVTALWQDKVIERSASDQPIP